MTSETRKLWFDDIDQVTVDAANHHYERARILGHPDWARPWLAAVDRIVTAGQLLTRADADRRADGRARGERAAADVARDQIHHIREQHERQHLEQTRALAAVRALVNHQRKTLRMADLVAALDGERP